MNSPLRILRYNTGTDKKAFVKFKNEFDAVIFNATIVAYSGAAVADLVSVHKRQYIIDPQTHIFQHDISALQAKNKKGRMHLKKSIEKYLNCMPEALANIIIDEQRTPKVYEVESEIDELVKKVWEFETSYVDSFIKTKEYDKYLKFAKVGPIPRFLIAPYFMIKNEYDRNTNLKWLSINKSCIEKYVSLNIGEKTYDLAAQLVLDKESLLKKEYLEQIKSTYNVNGYDYLFIWIDDFDSFDANYDLRQAFYELLKVFDTIGKKPIMAYGGYDSILLCNTEITHRLYGVAQSVGYGEARNITPVGGGLPVNKYYFYPIHRRLRFDEAASILSSKGYFSGKKSSSDYVKDYFDNICDCKQCYITIKNDINNFSNYNDSIPFTMKTRYGIVSRNRPTTDASLIAAIHFLYCKIREWNEVNTKPLNSLIQDFLNAVSVYAPEWYQNIKSWCEIYAR
ncbi:hypothetical protein EQM14_10930 [Caproiciproducens sp. NJN-50]|uniref:hypothetical protein n=1 Tax=Acutalibacteraceae TaxID=3082771 RepID=UPI000FFDFDD5|nr:MULTISPECIES: hypothetical protein [Acutalibacteraceae]QAT50236.1 hypothetical protein EQM14_10930 [Caproiciproducens sp. NJN-50]